MNIFFEFIFKAIKILRGSASLKFSIALISIGASLLTPELWEWLIGIFVDILNILISEGEIEKPQLNIPESGNKEYILSILMITTGVIIFIYFYKKELKSLTEYNLLLYRGILGEWKTARDISNDVKNVDIEDVIMALNLINQTTVELNSSNKKTIDLFLESRKDDFKKLYTKLNENKYVIGEKKSNMLILSQTHNFYNKNVK